MRGLKRIDFPTAEAHALLIEAGTLVNRGETELASRVLERAEGTFAALGMSMFEAVAKHCRATQARGDEARSLTEAAQGYFEAQGVARPDRIARMVAPGFDERRGR